MIEKTKNGENVPSLDLVEVFLQYNLVGNQYEQTLEVSFTSTTNKSYAYLLSVSVKYYLLSITCN